MERKREKEAEEKENGLGRKEGPFPLPPRSTDPGYDADDGMK